LHESKLLQVLCGMIMGVGCELAAMVLVVSGALGRNCIVHYGSIDNDLMISHCSLACLRVVL